MWGQHKITCLGVSLISTCGTKTSMHSPRTFQNTKKALWGACQSLEAHASLSVRFDPSNSAILHCMRNLPIKEALFPASHGAASGIGPQANLDPLTNPAHYGRRPVLYHGVMSTCEEEVSLCPFLQTVLFGGPSKDSSFLGQKRNLEVGASPIFEFQHCPTVDGGGLSHSQQPMAFQNRNSSGQGGEGCWEWGVGGSQALLAKPFKKASSLERKRDATFFPLHLHPKANGVLLTSHKKQLMTDSSNGNERAIGLGSELGHPPEWLS